MALTGYMQIVDAEGNVIEGESRETGREKWVQIWGCSHAVRLPTDSRGLPNGKRIHFPIEIFKEVDRTSPLLNQYLSRGELLQKVTIDWFRINPKTSLAEPYFRQTMENAQVNAVAFTMKQNAMEVFSRSAAHNMGHMEHIQFIYDDITWTILDGGVEYDDSTSAPKDKPAPAAKTEKPQKKKHLIYIEAHPEGDQSLPSKHSATIVVLNPAQDAIVLKQSKDILYEPESRMFKLEAGDEFKAYCVPPHLTSVLDDLSLNGNLNQSESDELIAPLEINRTETRQGDVTVHLAEYLIPDIKEFVFSA